MSMASSKVENVECALVSKVDEGHHLGRNCDIQADVFRPCLRDLLIRPPLR